MKKDWLFYMKIVLAILLLLCFLDMPYGYYQLVRVLAFIEFFYLGMRAHRKRSLMGIIIYATLAVLFQPFAKIALGRELWMAIDLVVAVGLVYSVIKLKE